MPTYVTLLCDHCQVSFEREKRQIKKNRPNKFCSRKCGIEFSKRRISFNCKNCNKENQKKASDPQIFCDSSCAASYNNKHREKGHNVSKFELWLRDAITEKFPNLTVKYNEKDVIESELDVYIPSLKLAIEVDGIHHKEAVFGEEILKRIQENDKEKEDICARLGIELIRVDISDMKSIKQNLYDRVQGILSEIQKRIVFADP